MTSQPRYWRRRYYDLFSHVYDRFIQMHARQDEHGTRAFLVEQAHLDPVEHPRVLDVCCGTGSVLLTFAVRYPHGLCIGCDFSQGMLHAARGKDPASTACLVQGSATDLPFDDNLFHAVSCSHALYELKGADRGKALEEMKRVVRPDGVVLIMEHEPPTRPVARFMFGLRMLAMGSADAKEFVKAGLAPYRQIFPEVSLSHSPSGRSKLVCCRKAPAPSKPG